MFFTRFTKVYSSFFSVIICFFIVLSLSPLAFAASNGHSTDTSQGHSASSNQGHKAEEKKVEKAEVQEGEYQVQFITPEKMFEGENEILVIITKESNPAKALNVNLTAVMDKSGTSMNMNHGEEDKPKVQTLSEVKEGEYSGNVHFEGDGKWLLTVQFLDEKTSLEVLVERSGPNSLVIGGFLGVIFSIILTAGLLKHKASKEGINNVSQ